MNTPNWREIPLEAGVQREFRPESGQTVFWFHADGEGDWMRLTTAAGSTVQHIDSVSAVAAQVTRTTRVESAPGSLAVQNWMHPEGFSVGSGGPEETRAVLAWSDDVDRPLDTERIGTRWPEHKDSHQLGQNLFAVVGVDPPTSAEEQIQMLSCPRAEALRLLAAARADGDPRAACNALIDLGVMYLSGGDLRQALSYFDDALKIAREIGDKSREIDVLGQLGMAALSVGKFQEGLKQFEGELALSRQIGDRFAEKIALEHMAFAHANLRDRPKAISFLDQALSLTRTLGDRQQEWSLLWHQAIQLIELGQRDKGVQHAQAAIDLAQQVNKPQADILAKHLREYVSTNSTTVLNVTGQIAGNRFAPAPIDASPAARPASVQRPATGPGLLRMGLSAARSVAKFMGSGFQTVSAATQQKRLEICGTCEQHTGLRCKVCGCFTNVKSRLPLESCPIGKWPG